MIGMSRTQSALLRCEWGHRVASMITSHNVQAFFRRFITERASDSHAYLIRRIASQEFQVAVS